MVNIARYNINSLIHSCDRIVLLAVNIGQVIVLISHRDARYENKTHSASAGDGLSLMMNSWWVVETRPGGVIGCWHSTA